MKTMNREELKEMFKSKWIKNEFSQEEKIRIEAIIDKLVDDLYNTSQSVVYPLTEKNTYIFRKVNGILDNGVCQTQRSVAEELGFAHARIGQILERIMVELHYHRVRRIDSKALSTIKMSSANLSQNEKTNNIEIGTLNLKGYIIKKLRSLNVVTLQDLLALSIQDLKIKFGNITGENIVNVVHSYGLKFIEELSLEEKRQIISNSSIDMVMNSSISWIDMSELSHKKLYENLSDCVLKSVIDLINQDELVKILGTKNNDTYEITNYAQLLGFKKEVNEENFLTMNISKMPFPTKVINALKYHNITSGSELIKVKTIDLPQINRLGSKSSEDIINYVHNCGYFFADEIEKMQIYSTAINEQLEDSSRTDELLARYHALSSEKKQLMIRSEQLDSEINEILAQLNSVNKGVGNVQARK